MEEAGVQTTRDGCSTREVCYCSGKSRMSAKIRKKYESDAGYRQRISARAKERLKGPRRSRKILEACGVPVRRAKISASERVSRQTYSRSSFGKGKPRQKQTSQRYLHDPRELHLQGS